MCKYGIKYDCLSVDNNSMRANVHSFTPNYAKHNLT